MSKETVTRVYRYGLLAPRDPAEHALALQLLGQAHHYAEDIRRVHFQSAAARKVIALGEAESSHVRVWEKACLTEDERAARKALGKPVYEALDEARNLRIRETRAKRGHLLDAGTYWLVEEAALAAAKMSGLDGPGRMPAFDGTGRIGAAIQSTQQIGLPDIPECEHCHRFRPGRCHHEVMFGMSRFTVAPADSSMDEHGYRRHHTLTLRVGDLKAGRSITWPLRMFQHRSLPNGALLKQVAVQRLRQGHDFRWEVLFTVSFVPAVRDQEAEGVVGIDVGWRLESEARLRVATVNGANTPEEKKGEPGVLFTDTVRSFRYADAVESFRDDAFNDAKAFVQDAGLSGAEHAKQWRNKDRLHRLADVAKKQRLPAGVREADLGAVWWQARDRHLESISAGVRGKAIRRRKEVFAAYADTLAKTYRYAVLEDMPMQAWVGKGETSERERLRSIAAVSLLQGAILHRFGAERVHWAPAKDTTRTCADCGSIHPTAVGPAPEWVCSVCGVVHHQDENAAIILRRMGEQWIGDGNTPRARSRKVPKALGKRERVVEKAVTEDQKEGTTREALANAAE